MIVDFKEEWQDVIDLLGANMVPTILFKDNYFTPGRDFNSPQDLVSSLKDYTPTKHSIERKILERLRTLNYSIHMAFRNTDGILRNIERQINYKNIEEEENEHKSTS